MASVWALMLWVSSANKALRSAMTRHKLDWSSSHNLLRLEIGTCGVSIGDVKSGKHKIQKKSDRITMATTQQSQLGETMATKAFTSVPTAPRGEKALRKKEEDETKPTVPLKKTRSSYYPRKDEVSTLKEEVRCLLNRLQELEATQHASKVVAAPMSIDQESMLRHAALSTSVNQNELLLAGAKSLLLSRVENPLKTHIHLTSDRQQRRNALIALRPQRLRDAAAFVRERVRFLDVCRPHRQIEVSETAEGDFVHSICEVVPFNGVSTSVQHVYNQLLAFMTHREFNIVEYSDVTTICEMEETIVEGQIKHSRFLTTTSAGVDMEKNVVHYQRPIEECDGTDPSYAMIVMDSVDQDDLYPYLAHQRMHVDVTSVMVVCETRTEGGKSAVSFIYWSFVRLPRATCGISSEMEHQTREVVQDLGKLMPLAVREAVILQEQTK